MSKKFRIKKSKILRCADSKLTNVTKKPKFNANGMHLF